ncbi:sensor histidine kinase [Stakelama saccharophila]|uniref:histidine kinase n=1 Tax=Stakelama saccharophila TaxID=3075605 RepID=A0ABZ0BDS5_9SPHN|nr:sensor histidine kinase [Stakelama sp. W311]WNO54911.1 sensor histidine kinase [Stakelama sp. W311]
MTAHERPRSGRRGIASSLAGIPTGAKIFLILSGALLPLAVIVFFASLQTTRLADVEARARLRVAAAEGSRALSNELIGDMTALRVALNTLDADPNDRPACARVQGVFAQQFAAGTKFAIYDARGTLLCGTPIRADRIRQSAGDEISSTLLRDRGLLLAVGGTRHGARAVAFFPTGFLSRVARPSGFVPPYSATLERGAESLVLESLPSRGPLDRRERRNVALGVGNLSLAMSVRSAPITSPVIVTMLLPLLMWAAAAGIGWFVVDRLLIRPLRRLRARVGAFKPGEIIDPPLPGAVPAQELRELGDTFRDISRTVRDHEANLAEGLVRQTRLTREVHHRVKNNLQVIASLINFHARSAKGDEATEAYASIQRRVDALAVVHRHHYAEIEEHHGLELRSVVGELASNLRATAPESAAQVGIALDLDAFLVSQDTAVAVAFLLTELVELAIKCDRNTTVSISLKPAPDAGCAILRVSSPALTEGPRFDHLNDTRYGRIIAGLARQLRGTLHHDPLVGAYEILILVRDPN